MDCRLGADRDLNGAVDRTASVDIGRTAEAQNNRRNQRERANRKDVRESVVVWLCNADTHGPSLLP